MIAIPKQVGYNDAPWEISLANRVQMARIAHAEGCRLVLTIYQKADTSTFRYRCYNVMQALEKSQKWRAVYFFENELEEALTLLPIASLVTFVRVKWTIPFENFATRVRLRKVPLLFDIDDRIFDLDFVGMVTNTLATDLKTDVEYDFWVAQIGRLQKMAACADGFTTTNVYLGKALQDKFGKPFQIIPNYLNNEQLAASKRLVLHKKAKRHVRPFTLGYFSGTPSHTNDFLCIYKELMAFLHKYPDTVLQVVGFMEFPADIQDLIRDQRVTFTPLVDFIELQRLIAQVDVNIVPLQQNAFTNSKSELKYFEAAIVDTVTVATPTFTYAKAIKNGETGFLCEPGQWFDVLEKLYLNEADISTIVSNAHVSVAAEYSPVSMCEKIEQAYSSFAVSKEAGSTVFYPCQPPPARGKKREI